MKKKAVHFGLAGLGLFVSLLVPANFAFGQSQVRTQDYLRNLVQLSEVLGEAHAIRTVCRGSGSQEWRLKMQDLLTLEAPNQGALRRSMVNGFNAGYGIGSDRYRQCDASAIAGYRELGVEGQMLSDRLTQATMQSSQLR